MASFQFKQFTIKQDKCAMKVGTDGVLLGSWVSPVKGNLLDIGCGTGLIALMIAQRVQDAKIDAIDINELAYFQALENVESTSWRKRVNVHHSSLQQFNQDKKYDLIFTNPPYFVQAFKAPNEARNTARHTDELSFDVLLDSVVNLLLKSGVFSLILPVKESNYFIELAVNKGLFLNRKCEVKPNYIKPVKRIMMEFSFTETQLKEESLTIETEKRHHYTKEYISLTQDFYLYDR